MHGDYGPQAHQAIGDVVKNVIELQGTQIKFLETYIKGHGG
jgi:hypothetical protein